MNLLLGPHGNRDISVRARISARVRVTLRWLGLRGATCAIVREQFPDGVVTRIWFGGLLCKVMRESA